MAQMSQGLVALPVQDMDSSFHRLLLTFKREKGLCHDYFIADRTHIEGSGR